MEQFFGILVVALIFIGGLFFSSSDDQANEQDDFIDKCNDGIGGINYHGEHLSEQEAREAHDRGEFYE